MADEFTEQHDSRPLGMPMGIDSQVQRSNREERIALPRLLWNSRSFILRVVVVGFFLSAVVAFVIPKRYTTSTRLMPPDSQATSSVMMLAGMAEKAGSGLGAMAGDLLGLKGTGALFVGMLQSETIQDRLVEQFELKKIYRQRLLNNTREDLARNTVIEEDHKSGIITITVTDHKAERAAAIANAYVAELNTMVAQLSTSAAHRERVFLEDRLQSVKHDLNDAETQLAQFSSKNSTLDVQQQGKAMLDAASSLAGQLIAADSELQGLRQIYTENNARVRELNARAGELRKELDRMGGVEGKPGGHSDADPEPVSDSSADMPYPSIRKLPLLGAKYADYYRAAKVQETVYELLTEQSELAKVEEAKETPSVKVLDTAEIPETKSYPPRLLFIGLGMLSALALAMVQIFLKSHWDQMGPGDDRKALAQEMFASFALPMGRALQHGTSFRSRLRGIREPLQQTVSSAPE